MENNEKLDWKPEVGKTAWLKRYPYTIEQVMIIADGSTKLHYRQNYSIGEGEFVEHTSAQDRDYFFESPEAALASIKIYDLEGKEVVIPRARPVFNGKDFNWMLRDEAGQSEDVIRGWDIPHVKQIPMRTIEEQNVMLSPDGESYLIDKQEYFDWCLRNEDTLCMFLDSKIRGGAAIGGKSDQREGGC